MPRADYKTCKGCGRPSSECGSLSHTRLCVECGSARRAANAMQLQAHSGPYFEHARRRNIAAWGGVLLDDTAGKA